MAKLLFDTDELPEPVWRSITIPPWNGDLKVKLRPYTQPLRDLVLRRAEKSKWNHPHSVVIDGETVDREKDYDRAVAEEFCNAAIEDWSGVVGDPPCDRENRIKLRRFPMLYGQLVSIAGLMAGVEVEDEQKN